MVYESTSGSKGVLRQLRDIVREVDDRVLARASAEARAEWEGLVQRLPSEADLGHRVVRVSEDELGRLLEKALRFREILRVTTAPIYDVVSKSPVAWQAPAP